MNPSWRIPIASEPAIVAEPQLCDLNRAPSLLGPIAAGALAPARMRKVEDIRAPAAEHDIAMMPNGRILLARPRPL
jgi:hypothetical protein